MQACTSATRHTKVPRESSDDEVHFERWKEDDEEALFQWRLFNVDVQRIRKLIRHLWELYRAGHLSLHSVATAHNLSIYMVRNLVQDIQPVFEKSGGYVNVSMTHFIRRYVGTATDIEEITARIHRLRPEGEKTFSVTVDAIIDRFDIAEEEMLFAWQVLISEAWIWEKCGTFGSYNGKWGAFRPRDDRQNMTNFEKYCQDKAVAAVAVHDLQILALYLNPFVGMKLDELSIAIEDIAPWRAEDLAKHHCKEFPLRNDKITFRAVFATQLLLDSTHVLGKSVGNPCQELLDRTARTFKSTKSLREFYEGPGALALGPLTGPSYAEWVETTAKYWQGEDPIAEFRRNGMNYSKLPADKVCPMLRHNAPLCGWWLQTVQVASYSHSIMIANSVSLPLACARLYFTFVQEGLVPQGSWPDMDAFSTLHRGDLWVGTAPKSGQYLQNLMLAGDNSIVGLASDARVSQRSTRHGRVKFITSRTNVSEKIYQAFVTRGAKGLTEEDLESLIADTRLRWYNGKAVMPCFHHGWEKAGTYEPNSLTSPKTR